MQIEFEAPSTPDKKHFDQTERGVKFRPVAVKGQNTVVVGFMTATGDSGAESKMVVLFNAKSGKFRCQPYQAEDHQFDFDKPNFDGTGAEPPQQQGLIDE